MDIDLAYPIEFEGTKLTKITLRRPSVKDARKARTAHKDAADQEIALVSALSGLPPSAIEELDLSDYSKIQEALSGFFGSGETTA